MFREGPLLISCLSILLDQLLVFTGQYFKSISSYIERIVLVPRRHFVPLYDGMVVAAGRGSGDLPEKNRTRCYLPCLSPGAGIRESDPLILRGFCQRLRRAFVTKTESHLVKKPAPGPWRPSTVRATLRSFDVNRRKKFSKSF